MLLLRTIGLLCLSLLLFVGSAQAGVIFHADLTTGAEAGANSFADPTRGLPTTGPGLGLGDPRPLSFGTADFFLNDAGTALSFTATVFNIDFTGSQTPGPNDNLVAAHIHAGGAAAPTFPVVWGFFGSPFNDGNSPGAGFNHRAIAQLSRRVWVEHARARGTCSRAMAPRLRRNCPTFWRDAHTSIFIRPSIPVARFAAFCRCPSLRPWSLWDSVFWALPEYGGAPYKAWL